MITVTVSGSDEKERTKIAKQVHELLATAGKVTLHYAKVNAKPEQFPEGLEVAVLEATR